MTQLGESLVVTPACSSAELLTSRGAYYPRRLLGGSGVTLPSHISHQVVMGLMLQVNLSLRGSGSCVSVPERTPVAQRAQDANVIPHLLLFGTTSVRIIPHL